MDSENLGLSVYYAEKIKLLRKTIGWTQERLALELECRVTTVSRWENGHNVPRGMLRYQLDTLMRLFNIEDYDEWKDKKLC